MEPIEANTSPLPDQIWAGLRQVSAIVGAFALGRGWIGGDTLTMIGGIGMVAGPFVVGQIKTRERAKALAALATDPGTSTVVPKGTGA